MENYKNLKKDYKVYFLGAGGISMSALAVYLKNRGFSVAGFDKEKNDCVLKLEKTGINVDSGDNLKIYDGLKKCDAVVYSSAISESDFMLDYAKKSGKAVMSRAELLAEIIKNYKFSFGVSGTHGKTTTTLMLCHVLRCANKRFDAHIGGADKVFDNFYFGSESGNDECIISEICEYKRNIALFSPTFSIVLNVDDDHLESYGSFSALADEFLNFALRGKKFVYNADDKTLRARFFGKGNCVENERENKNEKCGDKTGVSFSVKDKTCDYYAANIRKTGAKIAFNAFEKGALIGRFEINGVFKHNVSNALAVIACARLYGVSAGDIYKGLIEYNGAYRREEFLGEYNGAAVFADYCHHPKQIKETVAALEKSDAKNVIIVFQPHTYSRTKNLFKRFLSALKTKRARIIICETYAAREAYDFSGSGKRLAENIGNAEFTANCCNAVKAAFLSAKKGDLVAFLGAGDVYFKAKEFLRKNKKAGL